jgi:RES domain-containing protein
MQVYRLIKQKYAADPLDSEGARRYGGRWNSKGRAVLYASDTISLAALEILAHLHITAALNAYMCVTVTLPDAAILLLQDSDLPDDWRDDPVTPGTMYIGDEWLKSQSSLALSVPSTLIPQQRNFLVNPAHPDFQSLYEGLETEAFEFDTRLLR